MKPAALVSAPLAAIGLIGGWTVAAAVQPAPFDAVAGTISALAAEGTPYRWVMTTGLVVVGVSHLVTAWSLDEASAAGRVLLAAAGVGAGLVALFPLPLAGHAPAAAVSFVLLSVWPAFARLPTRAVGWAVAGVLSALFVWFLTQLGGPLTGLSERILAGAQVLWPVALVAALALRGRRRRHEVARPTVS